MKLFYIDTMATIDGENVDIYETVDGFRYRAGNYISRMFAGYDAIVKFLMKRGYRF